MKPFRTLLIIPFLMGIVAAPMFIVDSYKTRKASQENQRAIVVRSVVREKVEAYENANGHYPDSLSELTFTNSAQERDVASDLSKISYFRTSNGYVVGWDGDYVHLR